MSTRQYARLVDEWVTAIGLRPPGPDSTGEPGVLTLDIAATVPEMVRSALDYFPAE